MSNKAISDEQIITALMSCNSMTETAEALGLSRSALYDRLKDDNLKLMYNEAKAELLRNAVNNANSGLQDALNTVKEIINDKTINPETRLKACDKLIDYAKDFTARLDGMESTIKRQQDPLETFSSDNWFR